MPLPTTSIIVTVTSSGATRALADSAVTGMMSWAGADLRTWHPEETSSTGQDAAMPTWVVLTSTTMASFEGVAGV